MLAGKLIFRGNTATTGSEIFITDGTTPGTVLIKDINEGSSGCNPGDFVLMNGFVYFSAVTASEGRELWKTDGTFDGTKLLKDIVPGSDSSNKQGEYQLFSAGNYLLFAASTPATGVELWVSDGTTIGTNLLADINIGNGGADSSNPAHFFTLNGLVLFTATAATTGNEIWKTDGTFDGTILLKDINPGPASSTEIELAPGLSVPLFLGFHAFGNQAFFQANDGSSVGELWVSDGTTANTSLIKNIVPGTAPSIILLADAVNLPGKFIFPVSDLSIRSELWESDGTPGGTVLFKSFTPITPGELPEILIPFTSNIETGTFSQTLFQGKNFFFTGGTLAEGYELWMSDGTPTGTSLVKDIYPGPDNGIDAGALSYFYTSAGLFFSANDGVNGLELWKSDGTALGTSLVADILTGASGSQPSINGFIINGKVLFEANNGDSPSTPPETDLYAVDGNYSPLPITISEFKVIAVAADALLSWSTLQEVNSKDFIIQRSFNGLNFTDIGYKAAMGNSTGLHQYSFTDMGIMLFGQSTLYYRLVMRDMDGKTTFSKIITLKISGNSWNVRLLSNPVQEDVKLELTGCSQFVQVNINDMNGKILYKNRYAAGNTIIRIPTANIPHGYYELEVIHAGEKKSIRFVK